CRSIEDQRPAGRPRLGGRGHNWRRRSFSGDSPRSVARAAVWRPRSTKQGPKKLMPQGRRSDARWSDGFDHDSDPRFYDYFANASLSEASVLRLRTAKRKLRALTGRSGHAAEGLKGHQRAP